MWKRMTNIRELMLSLIWSVDTRTAAAGFWLAWVGSFLQIFEGASKVVTILLGLLVMCLGIYHKILQIKAEHRLAEAQGKAEKAKEDRRKKTELRRIKK